MSEPPRNLKMHTEYSITYKYTLGTVTFEGNMATPIGSIRVVQKKGPFLHHAYNPVGNPVPVMVMTCLTCEAPRIVLYLRLTCPG